MLMPNKKDVAVRASISAACNFDCLYCVKDLGMENHTPIGINAPTLTVEQYVENMRIINEHGVTVISFTGGEPLLNSELSAILKGCRPLFSRIEITTNGTNLIQNLPLIEQYVDVLKISCDAYSESVRCHIAQNESEAKNTLETIEACCQYDIGRVGINFVMMQQNKVEFWKLTEYISKLNETYKKKIYISLLDLYYSDGNRGLWEKQFVSFKDYRAYLKSIGIEVHPLDRTGCEFHTFIYNGVTVNMKDSYTSTHRGSQCTDCQVYCQEGIYSLKHSLSGWVSVCPTNDYSRGFLLKDTDQREQLNALIDQINGASRRENTYMSFERVHTVHQRTDFKSADETL
jgi:molybdenum cofactor biosynthesis enzyme MoaA